ncbi:hypothetical protein MtrunA17_Chr4g0035441 [Medicago truncatula]|uniref:Transmembrane protein n=1 Tax=Medicago truncatula TaxID=3880 RepID=A0A396I6S5_MEDTR|nr:hypothetical protein MtrunA17_Chr4g0035441 [Medicago truncatula]
MNGVVAAILSRNVRGLSLSFEEHVPKVIGKNKLTFFYLILFLLLISFYSVIMITRLFLSTLYRFYKYGSKKKNHEPWIMI